MDDFLTVFGSAQVMGTEQILGAFVMSFVLCTVLAAVYRMTFAGLSYSRSYVHTMVLAGLIVSMLIMAIGNNLARGLGILGTLAIIRFRTPIRDPRDMIFLFASLGVGIACGANTYNVAILGTGAVSIAALLLHFSPYASRREYEGLLRFSLAAGDPGEKQVQEVLMECCSAVHLIAMREAVQGEKIEYSYQIRLLDPTYQSDLVEHLSAIDGLVDTNLMMQRTTVEL